MIFRSFFFLAVVYLLTGCAILRVVQPVDIPYESFSSREHNDFGVVFEREGHGRKAERQFERAVRKDPGNAIAWTNYGNALKRRGKTKSSRDAYRRALALMPGYGPAVNNLAMTYLEDPDADPHLALTLIDAHRSLVGTNFISALNETRLKAEKQL